MSDDELRGRISEAYYIINRLENEALFSAQDHTSLVRDTFTDMAKRILERVKLYETALMSRTTRQGGEKHASIRNTDSSGPEQDSQAGG